MRRVFALVSLVSATILGSAIYVSSQITDSNQTTIYSSDLSSCSQFTCYTCKSNINIDQLEIYVNSPDVKTDGVKFARGCSGRIGNLVVKTNSGDAIKIADGASNLTIENSTISCDGRYGSVHQDGVQVMGGNNIKFTNYKITCPSGAFQKLDHSGVFFNGNPPPTDVVLSNGYIGSAGATVDIGYSVRSGVKDSTVCPSVTVKTPIRIPSSPSGGNPPAVNPITNPNTFPSSC